MNRLIRAVPFIAVPACALVALAAGGLASPLVFVWGTSVTRLLFR